MEKHIYKTIVAVILFLSPLAEAAYSPVSVSILPPLQFPPRDFSITGARVSALWGQHRDIYGVDLGLLGNVTEQDFVGIGVSGLLNITRGNTQVLGLQAAGLSNINSNKTDVWGVQLAGLVNSNSAVSSVNGLQVALLANLSDHTTVRGVQVGLYNKAATVYGLQIGLVNMAKSLYGIQIGLLNFHHEGVFKVSPVLNIGF